MHIVLQRVSKASVKVSGETVGAIDKGLCLLVGINRDDTLEDATKLIKKVLSVRVWSDDEGKMWKRSVMDINGGVLAVSQFTLEAVLVKGTKPDFHRAMSTDAARQMFNEIVEIIKTAYPSGLVQTGAFGELMSVEMINDGPVTLVFESNNGNKEQQ